MNIKRLHEILGETTCQLRKGAEVEHRQVGSVAVTEVWAMPHESEASAQLEKVDMCLLTIGVDKAQAEKHKEELISLLRDYPQPTDLASGPSYITVGAVIGDQGAAFQLFALGKVLGLWDVITPATVGLTGVKAREIAGNGFIMMSGYKV